MLVLKRLRLIVSVTLSLLYKIILKFVESNVFDISKPKLLNLFILLLNISSIFDLPFDSILKAEFC